MKKWFLNLLLLLCSVLVGLGFFELFLRASGAVAEPYFYRAHPTLLYEPTPNAAGLRSVPEVGAAIDYANDGAGFRARSDGAPRRGDIILVLGDSFVEAAQVAAADSFVELTEARLRADGLNVSLVNAGVSGYGTGQALLTYLEKGRPLKPKLVVLAFCSGNDVSDNSQTLAAVAGSFFALVDGELSGPVTTGGRPRPLKEWLKQHTRLIPWLVERKRLLEHSRSQAVLPESGVFREGSDARWREAWSLTAKLLERLNEEVKQDGARLAIAVLPVGYQVYANPNQSYAAQENLNLVEQRLGAIAAEHGIPLLPLLEAFRTAAQGASSGEPLFIQGIGHFTQAGHRLTSARLAPFLVDLLTR